MNNSNKRSLREKRKEVMREQLTKDLVFWKSAYITWRNVCDRTKDSFLKRRAKRYRQTAHRMVQKLEAGILICLMILMLGGCSGGVALSVSAGGSIHDPKHEDLAAIVEATPIMSTSTQKQFALPMVQGGGK